MMPRATPDAQQRAPAGNIQTEMVDYKITDQPA